MAFDHFWRIVLFTITFVVELSIFVVVIDFLWSILCRVV